MLKRIEFKKSYKKKTPQRFTIEMFYNEKIFVKY